MSDWLRVVDDDELLAEVKRRNIEGKRIAELEAALGPFASMSDSYDDDPAAHVIASKRGTILSVYDLRIAKASILQIVGGHER